MIVPFNLLCPDPLGGGIKRRCCLTSVCLTSVAYFGPQSRTERPRKTKIGTEVAHITRDSNTIFKVNVTGAGHIVAASRTACFLYVYCMCFVSVLVLSFYNCFRLTFAFYYYRYCYTAVSYFCFLHCVLYCFVATCADSTTDKDKHNINTSRINRERTM